MRARGVFAGVIGMILAFGIPQTVAQDARDSGAAMERLQDQLAGVNGSLDRLVTLLEGLVRQQEVSLLLKRIELREQRLSPLESRRRHAEDAVTGVENELGRLHSYLDQINETHREELRSGVDPEKSGARREIVEIERAIEREEVQLDEARRRLRQAEDGLLQEREEVEDLDDQLQELLAVLQDARGSSRSERIGANP